MEPHTSVAIWNDGILTMYESTQGVHSFQSDLAPLFGLEPERPGHLAIRGRRIWLKARGSRAGRPRGDGGTRTARSRREGGPDSAADVLPQRLPSTDHPARAARGRPDGTLTAVAVDVLEQSSRTKEFAEGSDGPARMMYAAPQRRTTNRPVVLDVPVPTWMRAPGTCPDVRA